MCVTNTSRRHLQPPISLSGSLAQHLLTSAAAAAAAAAGTVTSTETTAPHHKTAAAPRRRHRKPQKPGKTAKMHDRHFVVHNYHDHAHDDDDTVVDTVPQQQQSCEHAALSPTQQEQPTRKQKRRGGVSLTFPIKLHTVLEQIASDPLASHVIGWQEHGRCFVIHDPTAFVTDVMPKYFRQSKLTSFQRQLNLYGFNRITRGPDAGGYYHELFLRGKTNLCQRMTRTKVKGTRFKAASSPEQEPNFYQMEPVVAAIVSSGSEEESSDEENCDATGLWDPLPFEQQQQQQPVPSFDWDMSFFLEQPTPPPTTVVSSFSAPPQVMVQEESFYEPLSVFKEVSPTTTSMTSSNNNNNATTDDEDVCFEQVVDDLFAQDNDDEWMMMSSNGGIESDLQLQHMLDVMLE